MQQYSAILSQCPLFAEIKESDWPQMVRCLDGRIVQHAKGSPVFLEGDAARFLGVVLDGAVQIVREDYYGRRSVLTVALPGELFAEAFVCAGLEAFPVSAFARQPSTVLLLDCRRALQGCTGGCGFHSRLVYNLLQVIARKNLALTGKIRHMSPKTTREKLLEYLSDQAKAQGGPEFVIPFDRQALADYLGVERSAMSAELSKMQKAGLLETRGSRFRLLTG
ncbi:MAG: Crp/Fnr family transcriptional regulator [Gemmiger sp.]